MSHAIEIRVDCLHDLVESYSSCESMLQWKSAVEKASACICDVEKMKREIEKFVTNLKFELSQNEIQKVEFDKSAHSEACIICFEPFSKNTQISAISHCGHFFHVTLKLTHENNIQEIIIVFSREYTLYTFPSYNFS